MKLDIKPLIWDETLRDGEQSPGVAFSVKEKVDIAKFLDRVGVDIIDLGFPAISEDERTAIIQINNLGLKAKLGVTVRLTKDDILLAKKCGCKTIFMFAPTSEILIRTKFNMDYSEIKNSIIESIKFALNSDMEVFFISEDSTRSDIVFLTDLFNNIYKLGVESIVITDTIGIMTPSSIGKFVRQIINSCDKRIKFGIHCHNDFGLATANTISSLEEGIIYATATVNGIGERSGNASIEEIIMILTQLYNCDLNINTTLLLELSKMVENYSLLPVSANKAIVGYSSFRHESGIHINSMIKNLNTYLPFDPGLVGQENKFVYGKHSGKAAIRYFIENRFNEASKEDISAVLKVIKEKGREDKKLIIDKAIGYYNQELAISEVELEGLVERILNR